MIFADGFKRVIIANKGASVKVYQRKAVNIQILYSDKTKNLWFVRVENPAE